MKDVIKIGDRVKIDRHPFVLNFCNLSSKGDQIGIIVYAEIYDAHPISSKLIFYHRGRLHRGAVLLEHYSKYLTR